VTTPGDSFSYTDDTVAARLSVDVPADSIQSLDAMVRRADDLRTSMEAIARANSDVIDYLREMPNLLEGVSQAQSRWQDALLIGSAAGRAAGGLGSGPRSAAEVVTGQAQAPRGGIVSAADAQNVQDQVEDLQQRDPRQAANMRAQRGTGEQSARDDSSPQGAPARRRRGSSTASAEDETPQSPFPGSPTQERNTAPNDWVATGQQYASQGQGLVNQVLQETRQGAGGSSNLHAATRLARTGATAANAAIERAALAQHVAEGGTEASFRGAAAAGGRMGAAAGAVGTIAKGAGVAGIALAGFQASQSIGEQYQQYKNAGMIRGGGASEGFGYEMQARAMAMSPFLNTEQSRQIINSALTEGYTGKEFDTVTGFMAENLKNMNMSVAQSVKLLNTNVIEGGQSISSLNTQLETMKGLAGNGYATLQSRQDTFQKVSEQGVKGGLSGTQAGLMGTIEGEMFSGDKMLAGQGADLFNTFDTNFMAQQSLRTKYGLQGVAPDMLLSAVSDKVGGDMSQVNVTMWEGVQKALQSLGPQLAAAKTDTQRYAVISQAQTIMKMYGIKGSDDIQIVTHYLELAIKGDLVKEANRAGDAVKTKDEQVTDKTDGGFTGTLKKFVLGTSGPGNPADDARGVLDVAGGFIHDLFTGGGHDWHNTTDATKAFTTGKENRDATYANPRIQELVTKYGSGSIEVEKEGGGTETLDQNNKDMIDAVAQGKRKVSINGGDMMTLSDAIAQGGNGNGNVGNTLLDLTDAAKKLVVQMDKGNGSPTRTNTGLNADSNYNRSQNNSPTPSELAPNGGR